MFHTKENKEIRYILNNLSKLTWCKTLVLDIVQKWILFSTLGSFLVHF